MQAYASVIIIMVDRVGITTDLSLVCPVQHNKNFSFIFLRDA